MMNLPTNVSRVAFLWSVVIGVNLVQAQDAVEYGVDVSWPMHHARVSTNFPWLPHNVNLEAHETPEEYKEMVLQPLGDVQKRHDEYMKKCFDFYEEKANDGERCYSSEEERIDMILKQPAVMINFTETGYGKARLPDFVMDYLTKFWETNQEKQEIEGWEDGDIHVNHWESPSYMLNLADSNLEGGGYALEQHVVNAVRRIVEEWTGQRQFETSVYGVRVYKSDAILAPHVDRNPLVTSAIVNVAQDLDEPWVLEVIGHDGKAHNVTQEPGEIVLYESHSVIHGRHFPLKGRYMANIFVHFEPIGPIDEPIDYDRDLPPYMDRETEIAANFLAEFPDGYLEEFMGRDFRESDAHVLAADGDIEGLDEVIQEEPSVIHDRDENGWTPLAEAVRNADLETVRFLIDQGSDFDVILGQYEDEGSIMYMAEQELGEDAPVTLLLKELDARVVEPMETWEDEL